MHLTAFLPVFPSCTPLAGRSRSDGADTGPCTPRFTILTTTKDRNGTEYISTIEAKKYPFFGGWLRCRRC